MSPETEKTGILLRGGRIIDPALGLDEQGDVLVKAGRIAAVGANLEPYGAEVFSARGLIICPGLVDMHVHLRSPGDEHKEDIASGSAAAAAGGFTALACEPNTRPPLDSGMMVKQLVQKVGLEAIVPVCVKGCLTIAGRGEEVVDVGEMKACGATALSNDGEPIEDAGVMKRGLAECRRHTLIPTIHAEAGGGIPLQGDSHCREPALVAREIFLAAKERAPIHFSHISTREAAEAIYDAKKKGLAVTAEATPHHIALCGEDAPVGDANFKMNPPLRSPADREALQKAVVEGVIDCIATDHAPHAPEEKSVGFTAAPFGVIGLETALGVVLTALYHSGLMSLGGVITAMSARPRAILGLPEVRLAEGFPADLTVFDADAQWSVEPERFRSKSRNSPFAGKTLKGR
ncbi:MAG: amidohydrolase family protein, partial [Armatimonadetes bacterium]|nr:amidohydrolase family protein [Armatimonadota bacterium]NIM24845.1 amidohydrolase family protein [Armatimonadota bacterium]NIM68735.1 amidohydrolase family protein [Armatimonadota bacterium]NIM76028.1 amidohydrolase family protein [Armatimonadota bacterium]NIN06932.1 amidohydrolase family protein [Armatimonadota bacterium]